MDIWVMYIVNIPVNSKLKYYQPSIWSIGLQKCREIYEEDKNK